MGIYVYPNNTETELSNAYIGIPNPTSIVLDKSSISLTTIGQTEQLTATITPDFCDKSIVWTTSDPTIATVAPATPRLPSAYQEVEYIESTGTQYIETGVAGSMDMTTELKLNSQYIGESAIFGSAWSLNGNFLMFYNDNIRWHSSTAVDVGCSLNTDYTIATENGKITVNGTSYTNTASSSVSTNDVKLFECATGPMGQFKLYYFKLRKGGTIVRDFVPCYRKADDEIGLYDLVNDVFYTNSGTGIFTKGNDVSFEGVFVTCVTPGECTITATTVNGLTASCGVTDQGWQPGANTLCYYPFDTDYSDQSGNGYNLTNRGATTIGTKGGVDCAVFIRDSNSGLYTTSVPFNTISTSMTFNFWMYVDQFNTGENNVFGMGTANAGNCIILWYLQPINIGHRGYQDIQTYTYSTLQTWQNIVVTQDSSGTKIYLDGNQIGSSSYYATLTGNQFNVGYFNGSSALNRKYIGGMSNLILESKTWTAQEVEDYYNQTKSLYGIS